VSRSRPRCPEYVPGSNHCSTAARSIVLDDIGTLSAPEFSEELSECSCSNLEMREFRQHIKGNRRLR